MGKHKIPIWYLLLAAIALGCLIYGGMISHHISLSGGAPIDTERFPNPRIWENVPPVLPYTLEWGVFDVVGGFICMFLGLICFVLAVIRTLNKLGSKQVFLIGLFSALFAANTLSMLPNAVLYFNPALLFYVNKISFYGFPVALFLHYYNYLRPSAQRWLLPPVLILAAYGAAAWLMFFAFGLPFDMPDSLYSYIAGFFAFLFLPAGSLWAESKGAAWYIRILTAFWAVFWVYIIVKTLAGSQFFFHDEFKNAITISGVYMICHILFISTRQLVGHQSEIQLLEMKNEFLLENYKTLESHIAQIAHMKHELRHHLLAVGMLLEKRQYGQLSEYLAGLNEDVAEIGETVDCDNHVIQAVLTHAAQRARQMGFEIEFDISPLPPLSVPDADIVSLFMNLLGNALESCANIAEGRWIKVQLNLNRPYLYLSVLNARRGDVTMDSGRYVSTKHDRILHGHGIEIVRKIAERHGGFASFEHTADSFSVEVALKLPTTSDF